MKHSALRPAHRGRPKNLGSFRSFLSPFRPPSSLRPLSPPPSGSGRKQYSRKCSALYGGVAFYRSVAGFRVTRTFPSLASRPAHSAFRQCGWSCSGGGRGLGVSGGNPSSRCWLGLEPWMWANFWATRYEGRGGPAYRSLTRAGVSGRGTSALASHLLSPLSQARVPSLLMSEFLISLHSPKTLLGPFSPFLLRAQAPSSQLQSVPLLTLPWTGAWFPSTLLKAPDHLHNHLPWTLLAPSRWVGGGGGKALVFLAFELRFLHWLAMWLGEVFLPSLSSSFCICKTETVITT